MSTTIKTISTEQTIPLRSMVLRPGLPESTCHLEGDQADRTQHFGLFKDEKILAIVSRMQSSYLTPNDWQIRAMAVHPDHRREGLGREILQFVLEQGKEARTEIIWCNAREVAVPFYRSLGFQKVGDVFTVPGIGPHYKMVFASSDTFHLYEI